MLTTCLAKTSGSCQTRRSPAIHHGVSEGIRTPDIQDHNRGHTLTGGLIGHVRGGHGVSYGYDHRVSAHLRACGRSHPAPRIGHRDGRSAVTDAQLRSVPVRSGFRITRPALAGAARPLLLYLLL